MPNLRALAFAATAACLAAQQPSAPAFVEHADGSVTIRGRIVFSDLQGMRHECVQGSTQVWVWLLDPGSGSQCCLPLPLPTAIADGQWATTFGPFAPAGRKPVAISLQQCTIGSDSTTAVEPAAIPLAKGADLVFQVRAIPDLTLRVIDAATRKDIAGGVDLFPDFGSPHEELVHPGTVRDDHWLLRDAASPLVVPPPTDVWQAASERRVWVRAPGYAWQRILLRVGEGRAHEVALVPAGVFTVTIDGKLPEAPTLALRLYRDAASSLVAEFRLSGAEVEPIEGLAPGRYRVRLELGDWYANPRILAESVIEVIARESAQLSLRVREELVAPAGVSVRGTLLVPAQWLAAGMQPALAFEPLGTTVHWASRYSCSAQDLKRGNEEGHYHFDLSDVPAGLYQVIADPGQHRTVVRVRSKGLADLTLELPPPAEVVLRILDASTKQRRKGVEVRWHTPLPLLARTAMWTGASYASAPSDSDEVRFLAPVGKIVVSAKGGDYELEPQTIDIEAGKNEFELTTTPLFGICIALYRGDTRIERIHSGWWFRLDAVDGTATGDWVGSTDTLTARSPGRYWLRVTAPDDYEPVPDRQVTLAPGLFPIMEIKVARKR